MFQGFCAIDQDLRALILILTVIKERFKFVHRCQMPIGTGRPMSKVINETTELYSLQLQSGRSQLYRMRFIPSL